MNDFRFNSFYIIFSSRGGGNIPLSVKPDTSTTSGDLITSGGTSIPIM